MEPEDSEWTNEDKRLWGTEKALVLKHILQEHYLSINWESLREQIEKVRGTEISRLTDRKADWLTGMHRQKDKQYDQKKQS